MRDTCEKCFKDVEADGNGCCPICGGNLAKMKAARPPEWDKPEDGPGLFTAKHAVMLAAALAVFAAGYFMLRMRESGGEKLYPGDKKVKGPDGVYTITYGPNHPGRVSGLVFDSDLYAEYAANDPSAPVPGPSAPVGDPVLDNVRLGAVAAARGNYAGMKELRRQRGETREKLGARDAREKALYRNYGLGGAAVTMVREDGVKAEATADEVGRFSVEIPPGKYQVTVSCPGCGPYEGGAAEVVFEQVDTGVVRGNISRPLYKPMTFLSFGIKKSR